MVVVAEMAETIGLEIDSTIVGAFEEFVKGVALIAVAARHGYFFAVPVVYGESTICEAFGIYLKLKTSGN